MSREQCTDKLHARAAALVEFVQLNGGSATVKAARDNFPAWSDNQFFYAVHIARRHNRLKPWVRGYKKLEATVAEQPARTRPTAAFAERRA